jgi:D-alanyl-D-alanine carboxypeptidase/D-alanyl-D-alanine-endopeptidase (penicillin-binding protein 4)
LTILLVQSLPGATSSSSPSIAQQIEQLGTALPALHHGHIGFRFVDADSGEILAEHDPDGFFIPASNVKLYTTALALARLGSDYRFTTTVVPGPGWSKGQTAVSSIRFVGGGDPNLSGRILPFSQDAKAGDPLSAVNQLADQIANQGIRRVKGDVIGDDTRYPYSPYPGGWTFDDGLWYYGTPVSALAVNDSAVHLRVVPGSPGELAEAYLAPDVGSFIVQNQILTVAGGESHVSIGRRPGSNELVLSGTIGQTATPVDEDLGVPDPALFAARALKTALGDRGIAVEGDAVADHSQLTETPAVLASDVVAPPAALASITSAPLSQVIQVINKVSQNLHAEMLLREVGLETRKTGTLEAGLNERDAFLQEAGIPAGTFSMVDGSGLARQNLASPSATVMLLQYMWKRPERDVWLASLPTGGIDGSLHQRFRSVAGGERIHAKTGSMSHVSTLSGYLQRKNGLWVIFSMMANSEADEEATEVRNYFDRACELFVNY